MSGVVNAVGQVPFVPVLIVLFMLFLVVFVVSRDRRKDCFRLFKGVFVTVVISFVVFSSVVVLKYFSYLKIDVMQLGVWEVLLFGVVFGYVVFSRSLSSGKGVVPVSVPYPVKQILLFLVVFVYLLRADTGFGMYWLVVAVMPFNVVYHLYYVKVLDKVFALIMKVSERVDEKVGVNE